MTSKRLDAEIAIVGNGELVKNASLVHESGKIKYFGEGEHAPSIPDTEEVPVIMPGLWDCHVHFTGNKSFQSSGFTNLAIRGARSVWDLEQLLLSGFTSVRELGGLGVYLNKGIEEGSFIGPKIYAAGSILSMTGGHGDLHAASEIPLDITKSMQGAIGEVVDGVEGGQIGVRRQIRKGAEVIKIAASGGGASPTDPKLPQFSIEEITAIVEEANRSNRSVAAHSHSNPGIKNAIKGGVTTIEHGTYIDEDVANLMIETGTILVPTTTVPRKGLQMVDKMPEHTREKAEPLFLKMIDSVKLAIKMGVKIALGTDSLLSGKQPIMQFGQNADELGYYVEYGMSPLDAITTATRNASQTVGKMAQPTGILKDNFNADFIVLTEDPTKEISVLSDRSNFLKIVKQGIQYSPN